MVGDAHVEGEPHVDVWIAELADAVEVGVIVMLAVPVGVVVTLALAVVDGRNVVDVVPEYKSVTV